MLKQILRSESSYLEKEKVPFRARSKEPLASAKVIFPFNGYPLYYNSFPDVSFKQTCKHGDSETLKNNLTKYISFR